MMILKNTKKMETQEKKAEEVLSECVGAYDKVKAMLTWWMGKRVYIAEVDKEGIPVWSGCFKVIKTDFMRFGNPEKGEEEYKIGIGNDDTMFWFKLCAIIELAVNKKSTINSGIIRWNDNF